jgi:RHS repeat-associated protein
MAAAMNAGDKNPAFGYNGGMEIARAGYGPGNTFPAKGPSSSNHGPSSDDFHSTADTTASPVLPQTGGLIDTYYIWGYDGKLLAEYDHAGICSREYIYAGNRLVAEYQPQTGQYYYYMSDQVNSSRMITGSTGDVVYSAGYEPFGGVMTTWIDTYDPQLKFSGKERESYTGIDYFGARYYDNLSYRFLSPDPVMSKEKALANPQYWNLYAYCGNNPINFIDLLGLDNYVFYDPKNFSKQANVEAGRLKNLNGEATHSMPIRTEDEFKTAWSGMNDPTEVTLLFHSGGGAGLGNTMAIDAKQEEYLVTNPSGKTPSNVNATYIGNLSKKSINAINLYICHSADYTVKNNIASTFFKTQHVDTVRGVQGAFNYNRWYMFLVLETPWYAPRESNQYVEYRR